MIGVCTAVIGDVAGHLGCWIYLKDSVNAIAFVALGTSVPGNKREHGKADMEVENVVNITLTFFLSPSVRRRKAAFSGVFFEYTKKKISFPPFQPRPVWSKPRDFHLRCLGLFVVRLKNLVCSLLESCAVEIVVRIYLLPLWAFRV